MKLKESLLILFLLLTPIITFKCGANDIKDVKINKVSQPDYKRRLSSFYTPIQIKMDYSYLDSQKNSNFPPNMMPIYASDISRKGLLFPAMSPNQIKYGQTFPMMMTSTP